MPFKYSDWIKRLGADEGSVEGMMQRLLANVGTSQREGYNRASELGAANDLPIATQLAMKQGTDLSAGRAISEGTVDIGTYADQANRQAWQQILSAELEMKNQQIQEQAAADAASSSFWGQVLGGIGTGAGFLLGGPLGAAADSQAGKLA